MFKNFILGILGGLGIIQKHLKFKKSQYADFVKGLPPCSVVLTRDRTPGFFGGGIQAVTNSAWQHALLYIGKSYGDFIRAKFPHLQKKREIIVNGNKLIIEPIPAHAIEHEIVESLLTVSVQSLDKYNDDDVQMEAWTRPLTQQEMELAVLRAYEMVGMPYDILEIGAHVFPFIPNPDKLKVCSSLVVHAYKPVERIVRKRVDPDRASPRDLRDYFVGSQAWSARRFNW